jgi:hypothetical protein
MVVAGLLAGIGGSLSACGGRPAAATGHPVVDGVVTGTAAPCDGPVINTAILAATVTIKGSGKAATQTVRGDHVYRFDVPPGRYKIWSNASTAVAVVAYSGQVTHLDLPDLCS